MRIITDAELLAEVEGFIARTEMPHTRFGREAMSDGSLVQHLRAGRSLSLRNAEKLVRFMASYEPAPATSPRRDRGDAR